jgi:hypothetical protein
MSSLFSRKPLSFIAFCRGKRRKPITLINPTEKWTTGAFVAIGTRVRSEPWGSPVWFSDVAPVVLLMAVKYRRITSTTLVSFLPLLVSLQERISRYTNLALIHTAPKITYCCTGCITFNRFCSSLTGKIENPRSISLITNVLYIRMYATVRICRTVNNHVSTVHMDNVQRYMYTSKSF